MFREALQLVVDGTEGGIAAILMGYDGIPLEQYIVGDSELNVETVGMEFSVVLSQIRKAAEMLEAGTAREVTIQAEQMTTVIRLLNDEYFVAVALKPTGNSGKARYLLRTNAGKLVEALT
jgi:predicted regulator of Ras-like GTPase activity (Roadblock/LC7/MglB family)